MNRRIKQAHRSKAPDASRHAKMVPLDAAEAAKGLGLDNANCLAGRRCALLAGGYGRRLRPLTKENPKPLLHVGGKPILQHTVERFRDQGLTKFTLCVHYRSEAFREHFRQGHELGVEIEYLEEENPLGTAGPLGSLAPPNQSFFVMNGDVLSDVDLQDLLSVHESRNYDATMCIAPYELKVPYGVVEVDNGHITRMEEQPSHKFLVNAGIYVLKPSVLSLLPAQTAYDMPSLLTDVKRNGGSIGSYLVDGYWQDVGNSIEFERAQQHFQRQESS